MNSAGQDASSSQPDRTTLLCGKEKNAGKRAYFAEKRGGALAKRGGLYNFVSMKYVLLSRFLRALSSLPQTLRRTPQPRIVMTLLVKNEAEMLERHLAYHKAMGVDAFIVTDNNSTDATPDILRRYRDRGWIVEVIEEHATGYEQKQWVDRMVMLARDKYRADWVINADADEFWTPANGDFKTLLAATSANVLACEMRSVYPDEGRPWTAWDKTVRRVDDYEAYHLSRFSLFERQNKKVIHRTAGYLQIAMGNHKVKMFPQREKSCDVLVYHYNIRGRQQFIDKMVNGGRQLEQHKGRHGGRHWRYFYALYRDGRLDEEYDRVVGTDAFDRLVADGFIRYDCPMPERFRQYPPQE